MIVNIADPLVYQVILFFESPLNQEQRNKLDYILDLISELESDYHED